MMLPIITQNKMHKKQQSNNQNVGQVLGMNGEFGLGIKVFKIESTMGNDRKVMKKIEKPIRRQTQQSGAKLPTITKPKSRYNSAINNAINVQYQFKEDDLKNNKQQQEGNGKKVMSKGKSILKIAVKEQSKQNKVTGEFQQEPVIIHPNHIQSLNFIPEVYTKISEVQKSRRAELRKLKRIKNNDNESITKRIQQIQNQQGIVNQLLQHQQQIQPYTTLDDLQWYPIQQYDQTEGFKIVNYWY